jgi:hypothetical protein
MDKLIESEKMNDIKTQFLLEAKARIEYLIEIIEMNNVDVLTAMMFIKDSITIGNMEDAVHRIDYAIEEALRVLSSMEEFREGK